MASQNFHGVAANNGFIYPYNGVIHTAISRVSSIYSWPDRLLEYIARRVTPFCIVASLL